MEEVTALFQDLEVWNEPINLLDVKLLMKRISPHGFTDAECDVLIQGAQRTVTGQLSWQGFVAYLFASPEVPDSAGRGAAARGGEAEPLETPAPAGEEAEAANLLQSLLQPGPLQARRLSSLYSVPALSKAPEGGKGEASASFVVDCGSGHSKLYVYRRDGDDIREKGHRLSYVLSDLLAQDASAWESFLAECDQVGEMEKDPTAGFLLGATGGVRRALETGKVTQESWIAFGAAMQNRWPRRVVKQVVLTGTEEAMRELVAVRTLKRPMLARMLRGSKTFQGCMDTRPEGVSADEVGLLSGGGESCQIAWGIGAALRVECVRLSTVEAAKRINAEEAAGWEWWWQHLKELANQMHDWPAGGLTGTFIGTSLQANAAKACGCTDRYVSQQDLLDSLAELMQDLQAPEENENARLLREDWESYSKEPWATRKLINILAASRLHEMVKELFSARATFYFARKFEIVKGHQLDAQWPLGSFLAM